MVTGSGLRTGRPRNRRRRDGIERKVQAAVAPAIEMIETLIRKILEKPGIRSPVAQKIETKSISISDLN